MIANIKWFKKEILPLLKEYKIEFHRFPNGDFGDLLRFEIEDDNKGVTIDFWSSGWLGIHVYNFIEDKTVLNVLLEPKQEFEKKMAFNELCKQLQIQYLIQIC